MIDIIFLAHNRLEFTRAALGALMRNTDWSLVRRLHFYVDWLGEDDGTFDCLAHTVTPSGLVPTITSHHWNSPVLVMLDYIAGAEPDSVFAKIDNDTIVPSGWLNAAAEVMERNPQLDLLGIEPPDSRTPAPWAPGRRVPSPEFPSSSLLERQQRYSGWAMCEAIGGLGLMRTAAFTSRQRMRPHSTYGGFTDWQLHNPDLRIGWIVPPLKLFLLDRLPIEPWSTLSLQYVARGWQRPWTSYSMSETQYLAGWWLASQERSIRPVIV